MAKEPKFDIKINYPTPENQKAYEERVGRAVAKVLIETLPPEKIDELIEKYKERKRK
ncbi:4-alpha-glucanotransferase [Clostridium sporogenes]|uniref:4-alpha-glucanotransferase n=1 Tax=Clostridium sporogenes TaxID=1509 RepID=UPI0013D4F3C2|nr:4-alpha-glucanotransferase [Clostridium sporogenes]NFL55593.1 4-alpha-glucanotransferase [Clostridium botulinum]NFL76692.1 4-alpha-glucanotransferase [Clostridium sporogenes]